VARILGDPAVRRKLGKHRHGFTPAEFRKAAACDELLGLDEEFDLTDTAAPQLDVVAVYGDFAMPLMRVNLPLDRVDIGYSRVIHIFAPDIGAELRQESLRGLDVARHRARLDHCGALPVLPARFVIVQGRPY